MWCSRWWFGDWMIQRPIQPKSELMREWITKPSAVVSTFTRIITSGDAPSTTMGRLMKKMPVKAAGWARTAVTTWNSSAE